MAITQKQITQLNNMNRAAQNVQLGTMLMGGAVIPTVGSLTVSNTLKYTVAPAVKSATATHAALALTIGAQTGVTTGITQPDVPRTMTIKGNAAGIAGNVVIHGTNIAGAVVSDTIALNAATEVLGVVAFATITSIDFPAYTNGGTDTVSIGRGAGIGFPSIINNAGDVLTHDFDGSNDAGTVVADATLEKSVYIVAGTMNGVKELVLKYTT